MGLKIVPDSDRKLHIHSPRLWIIKQININYINVSS